MFMVYQHLHLIKGKLLTIILSIFCLFITVISHSHASSYESTIHSFKASPDTREFFQKAYGYAVFPTIGKAGFLLGGAFGKGKVYVNNECVGDTSLNQLNIGFQMGGQAFSELIFFENKEDFYNFTGGRFEFGANMSAAVITTGASAQTGTTGANASITQHYNKSQYINGIAVFVIVKGGLMYEMSVGRQAFTFSPNNHYKPKKA